VVGEHYPAIARRAKTQGCEIVSALRPLFFLSAIGVLAQWFTQGEAGQLSEPEADL
jgi:hypothetical protein